LRERREEQAMNDTTHQATGAGTAGGTYPLDVPEAPHLLAGVAVTGAVSLALVLAPTTVAVPVLIALAFASGRLGGLEAGLGSVSVAGFMFGWAITEPHFVWEIQSGRDQVLLIVLFAASLVVALVGARQHRRHLAARR
jgi:K+-sensing histidine kinase KdpD